MMEITSDSLVPEIALDKITGDVLVKIETSQLLGNKKISSDMSNYIKSIKE